MEDRFFRAETFFGGRKVHLRKRDTSAEYNFFLGRRIPPGGKGGLFTRERKLKLLNKDVFVGDSFLCGKMVLMSKRSYSLEGRLRRGRTVFVMEERVFCGRKDDM